MLPFLPYDPYFLVTIRTILNISLFFFFSLTYPDYNIILQFLSFQVMLWMYDRVEKIPSFGFWVWFAVGDSTNSKFFVFLFFHFPKLLLDQAEQSIFGWVLEKLLIKTRTFQFCMDIHICFHWFENQLK